MRFNVGDEVFVEWAGLTPAKIFRVFEKTQRYEVQHKVENWGGEEEKGYNGFKLFIREHLVFASREDYMKDKLEKINVKIKDLEKERKRLERELLTPSYTKASGVQE